MTEASFFKEIEDCKTIKDLVAVIQKHPKLKECLASWNDIYAKDGTVTTNLTQDHKCSLPMLKENVLEDADNLTHPVNYGDSDDPMSPASHH